MLSVFEALVLGIVQGVTEFLPVSSSGHLALVPWLFNWETFATESEATSFDAALHVGTFAAVVVAMRKDLAPLVRAGIGSVVAPSRALRNPVAKRAWLILLSALPAGVVGIVLRNVIADRLGGPIVVAVSLIVFGLVLGWADKRPARRDTDDLGLRDALVIGSLQVLALNPGTSRSGITIAAGRMLGYERAAAVRLSFLIGIPIVGVAGLFEAVGVLRSGVAAGTLTALGVGVVAAFLSGWMAIRLLVRLASMRSFAPFVGYRIVLGVVVLLIAASGLR
jgi:undecaprenyl-diphosphatase